MRTKGLDSGHGRIFQILPRCAAGIQARRRTAREGETYGPVGGERA